MDIKAENTKRIKDLEEEFSDEKIAELFRVEDGSKPYRVKKRRPPGKALIRCGIALLVILVCLLITLQYYLPRIVYDDWLSGVIDARDCIVIGVRAYDSAGVKTGDIIAYDYDTEDSDGARYGRVFGFSGDLVGIEDGGMSGGVRYISAEGIYGKVVFRLLPISRAGMLL